MFPRTIFTHALLAIGALTSLAPDCHAAAGTSQVAAKGQPVSEKPGWPKGVAELLRDPRRGDGWSDWFSEWPSDVDHYEFRAANTEQLNEVIATFCRIQVAEPDVRPLPPRLEIRLSPLAEPAGYGWVSKFENGNDLPAVFTLGNQQELDAWYVRQIKPNGGRFGVMQFEKAPVALPPTLTIFVGNASVDLGKLRVPESVHVSTGDLPRLWHKSNLIEAEPKTQPAAAEEAALSDKERASLMAIQAFLKTRTAD
jgi:hypothetical protein